MTTKNETPKNNFNATIGNTVICDGFLIPMTDFVLEQLNEQNSRTKPMREVFNSLEKYAKFLKQPLKLEMFVPCDEKGNVLEEPQMRPVKISFDEEDMDYDAQELYDYIEAKEKVLFKYKPQFYLGAIIHLISQGRNIEYLANFGSMQLTKTALNAIFG